MNWLSRAVIFSFVISFLSFGTIASAQMDLEDVILGCVSIQSTIGEGADTIISTGSGFIVSEDGFIVTNAHVIISNEITVKVKIGERSFNADAKLLGLDETLDIAILKVTLGGLDFLILGDDTKLKLGEKLFAVGSPLMLEDILTDGIYSSYNEDIGMLQHTCELSHGNSGGPLVTEDGSVVGVNTIALAIPGESRYFFAIPITVVSSVLGAVQGQEKMEEVIVDTSKYIAAPEKQEPEKPALQVTDNFRVTQGLMDGLYKSYPDGWTRHTSERYGYSVLAPWFYTPYYATDEDLLDTELEFGCVYKNPSDPFVTAVPYFGVLVGDASNESYKEFRKRYRKIIEGDGYKQVNDDEFDVTHLLPGVLEATTLTYEISKKDQQWTEYRVVYFLRKAADSPHYYCFDYTYNSWVPEYHNLVSVMIVLTSFKSIELPS